MILRIILYNVMRKIFFIKYLMSITFRYKKGSKCTWYLNSGSVRSDKCVANCLVSFIGHSGSCRDDFAEITVILHYIPMFSSFVCFFYDDFVVILKVVYSMVGVVKFGILLVG